VYGYYYHTSKNKTIFSYLHRHIALNGHPSVRVDIQEGHRVAKQLVVLGDILLDAWDFWEILKDLSLLKDTMETSQLNLKK
jgi:hypothetical protein